MADDPRPVAEAGARGCGCGSTTESLASDLSSLTISQSQAIPSSLPPSLPDVSKRVPMQRPDHGGSSRSPQPPTSLELGKRIPMRRPDHGGSSHIKIVNLLVNHFLVSYNKNSVRNKGD
ncbi:protein argonaute 3-like [Phoenix dactylifera]|uniref:Protein argonaute 3-like n=1 Tax=Phoenix dactylifera TaxID=42345 RepID=A0A8B9A0U5_PHODC|nr:protein argonaute 3-like [Phoenix dactylifera]